MAHAAPRVKNERFDTLYVGGGTPSLLELDEARQFFKMLKKHFKIKPSAEQTWEVNPGDLTQEKANLYRELGLNRISLGAQSFNDETLKKINRTHDARAIEASFKILRSAGFKNISMDLMLSLPGENLADVEHTLKEAVRLSCEHISLYELTVEEKTVFGHLLAKGQLKLPSDDLQTQMLKTARSFLKKNGYQHYELLSYTKPGFESRHNRIYWANESYLGLGPGAYSYINGKRWRFAAAVEEYLNKIKQNDWKPVEEESLDPDAKEIESLLLALRLLKEGAEHKRFKKVMEQKKSDIASLKEKGLVEFSKNNLRLTEKGQLFAESVFTELAGV